MTFKGVVQSNFGGFSFLQGCMLLMLGAFAMQVTMWAMDRAPPVETISSRAEGPASPGGTLVILYTVERHRSCPYRVDKLVRTSNDAMIPLVGEDDERAAAPGGLGRDTYRVYVPLPLSTDPGPASYRVILTYRCNLLQYLYPIIVRTETPFVVAGR